MGRILDYREMVTLGDLLDAIHVAGDARVMDHDDRASAVGECALDRSGVYVQRLRVDIDEHGNAPPQCEGTGSGDEREVGHDHLVPRLQAGENAAHLESGRARGGDQRALAADVLLEPLAATQRELAVARELAAGQSLVYVPVLVTDEQGAIEGISSIVIELCLPSAGRALAQHATARTPLPR